MSDKLFDEDAVLRIYCQWKAEIKPYKRDWWLADIWKLSEPLATDRIYKKVAYFTEDFEFEDWLSLLRQKFYYTIKKFNPKKGRLFSLLWISFDRSITGKLQRLCEKEDRDGVRPFLYENELHGYNDPDKEEREGFEKLEAIFIHSHGGCHGLGSERASEMEDI